MISVHLSQSLPDTKLFPSVVRPILNSWRKAQAETFTTVLIFVTAGTIRYQYIVFLSVFPLSLLTLHLYTSHRPYYIPTLSIPFPSSITSKPTELHCLYSHNATTVTLLYPQCNIIDSYQYSYTYHHHYPPVFPIHTLSRCVPLKTLCESFLASASQRP